MGFCQYTFKNKPNQPPLLKTLLTLWWNLKTSNNLKVTQKNKFFLVEITNNFSFEPIALVLENSSPILMLFFSSLQKERILSGGQYWTIKNPFSTKKFPLQTQTPAFTHKLFTQLSLKRKSLPGYHTLSPHSLKIRLCTYAATNSYYVDDYVQTRSDGRQKQNYLLVSEAKSQLRQ